MTCATSTYLLKWTVDPGWRLGEGASNLTDSAEHPFPVVAADGSVSLCYAKFRASQGEAPDGLWRATSVDGLTFTDEAYTGLYFGNDPEVLLLPSGKRIIYYGNFDPAIGGQLLSASCTWLLNTSDAAEELLCVYICCRRSLNQKNEMNEDTQDYRQADKRTG